MGQHSSDKLSLADSCSRGQKSWISLGLLDHPCFLAIYELFLLAVQAVSSETRVGTLLICIPSKLNKAYSMGGAQ